MRVCGCVSPIYINLGRRVGAAKAKAKATTATHSHCWKHAPFRKVCIPWLSVCGKRVATTEVKQMRVAHYMLYVKVQQLSNLLCNMEIEIHCWLLFFAGYLMAYILFSPVLRSLNFSWFFVNLFVGNSRLAIMFSFRT